MIVISPSGPMKTANAAHSAQYVLVEKTDFKESVTAAFTNDPYATARKWRTGVAMIAALLPFLDMLFAKLWRRK